MIRLQRFAYATAFFASTVALSAQTQTGKPIVTGTFHGQVHSTSGRAAIYKTHGKEILRITDFKTSNGPDVHVVLIAADDAKDDDNFLNEGDQNYDVPAGTDLKKFRTVAIYCERFNATFGAAPLAKF
jgi:Electron transfer DM13